MQEKYVPLLNHIETQAPEITRLARERGILSGGQDGDPWENVFEHSMTQLLVVDALGMRLLDPRDRVTSNRAALMHDQYKKKERMRQRTLLANEASPEQLAVEQSRLQKEEDQENRAAGFNAREVSLMRANIPPANLQHQDMAEKILWFGDAVLTGDKIVPIQERFDNLEADPNNGDANRAFSESFIPKYGMPLYQVQRTLGARYEDQFSTNLNIPKHELYSWLKRQVDLRLEGDVMPPLRYT